MALRNLRVAYENGSYALACPKDGVYNSVLATDVPELINVPANAKYVFFAKTADFWVNYVYNGDGVTELSDLVTNGSFASDTSWTKGTGWTISAGVASSDGTQSANSDLSQTPSVIVENQWYYVTFTVTAFTAGTITPVIGGTAGTARSSAATFSEYIKAGSGGTILLRADLDFVGSIDNFSAVPAAKAPTIDDSTGRASELNPTVRDLTGVSAISLVAPAATKISLAFFRG
jgi:hypothetical protein